MEKLRVADLNLLIDYKYDTMKKQCPPYKADFEKPNLIINIPKEEIIRLQRKIHFYLVMMWNMFILVRHFMRLYYTSMALCFIVAVL